MSVAIALPKTDGYANCPRLGNDRFDPDKFILIGDAFYNQPKEWLSVIE